MFLWKSHKDIFISDPINEMNYNFPSAQELSFFLSLEMKFIKLFKIIVCLAVMFNLSALVLRFGFVCIPAAIFSCGIHFKLYFFLFCKKNFSNFSKFSILIKLKSCSRRRKWTRSNEIPIDIYVAGSLSIKALDNRWKYK